MNQSERGLFDRALQRARLSAYPPGEFVGQESFMSASEILRLAARADVQPGSAVLDLCCGVAGPGTLITRELGSTYLGVDSCSAAVDIARDRARDLPCRFVVSQVPPVPGSGYDVVLLLETLLAFRDKETLLREVSSALEMGGRFLFTLEEGQPLTEAERTIMPDADTVWLTPMAEMLTLLERAGLRVRWQAECSQEHRVVAESLFGALASDAGHLAALMGKDAVDELLAAHLLWIDWLGRGRVRKFAVIAEKRRSVRRRPSSGPTECVRRSHRALESELSGSPSKTRQTGSTCDFVVGAAGVEPATACL